MNPLRFARFLYRQLAGYRLTLVFSMSMAVIQVSCEIMAAFPLKFILDKVIDHLDPTWPWSLGVAQFDSMGTRQGLNADETHTLVGVIVFSASLIIVLGVVGALASMVQLYSGALVGQNVSAKLRRVAFDHVLRLPLDWHGQKKSGDLVQRLTGNVSDIEKLIIDGLVDLLAGFLTIVGMIGVLFALNWRFTLISIVVVPGLFVIVWTYTKRIKAATKRAAHAELA